MLIIIIMYCSTDSVLVIIVKTNGENEHDGKIVHMNYFYYLFKIEVHIINRKYGRCVSDQKDIRICIIITYLYRLLLGMKILLPQHLSNN